MKKAFITLTSLLLLLSSVGCDNTTPISSNNSKELKLESEISVNEDVSSVTIYSEMEEIISLPEDTENAILTGSVIGGLTKYYCFWSGLELYMHDIVTEKYYKVIFELPSDYTNGELIALFAGAGSGELEIIIKASHKEKTVYLGFILYNYGDNGELLTNIRPLIAVINDEKTLSKGIS